MSSHQRRVTKRAFIRSNMKIVALLIWVRRNILRILRRAAQALQQAIQDIIERSKTLALPSGKTDSQKLYYAYSNIPYERRLR